MAGLLGIWQNWRDRRDVLREIRQRRAEASEWAHFRLRDDLVAAADALARGDRRYATELWENGLKKYPGHAVNSPLALDVLLGLSRFDEADALMNEGRTKHPADIRFAIGLASIARARGDMETAVQRWAMVRKQFPGAIPGYAMGIDALRSLNRMPEAEALTRRLIGRFPQEILGYMELARLADLQKDWEQALQRWDFVLTRFDHLSGYVGTAHAMVQFGRYDEAEALLTRASIRYPTENSPSVGLARSAQARGDVPLAVTRWKRVAERFPMEVDAVFASVAALTQLDATEGAEAIIREAIDHFPTEPRPLNELGVLLLRRRDFAGAAEAFATLRVSFPDNKASYVHGAEALSQAGRVEEADALRGEYHRRFN
jgi:tetratricopeptide (TPR) repeat protein